MTRTEGDRERQMLIVQIRQAGIAREKANQFEKLLTAVPNSYRPILRPAAAMQAEILQVREEEIDPSRYGKRPSEPVAARRLRVQKGELYTDGSDLFGVELRELSPGPRLVQRSDGTVVQERQADPGFSLRVYSLSNDPSSVPIAGLETVLNEAFGVELKPFYLTSNRLNELKSEGMVSPEMPSDEELAAAQLLADRAIRTLTTAVKSSAGLLVGDLPKQLPAGSRDRVEDLRATMLHSALVSAEKVVICKRTQAQVARVPSEEVLNELSGKGLKCACGRPVTDERVEEALAITDHGRSLLDKSRWFSVLLIHELLALGIPLERMLVDQQSGGDEMDCIADISGELTFFELKDKEFSLGNAYSFGAKIGIIRPDYRVIVTTEHVGNDAKDHFQRADVAGGRRRYSVSVYDEQQSKPMRYIEGTQNLRPQLEELVTEIYSVDAIQMLSEILPFALLDPSMLIEAVQRNPVGQAKPNSGGPTASSRRRKPNGK
jgi:hypothetical protein